MIGTGDKIINRIIMLLYRKVFELELLYLRTAARRRLGDAINAIVLYPTREGRCIRRVSKWPTI